MRQKKIDRIEKRILLSIQYSRLQEEISDTEAKQLALDNTKKTIFNNKDKKIKLNDEYINVVKERIKSIEDSYEKEDYSLYIKNKLAEEINLLVNVKNFEMLKYQIAIKTLLDNVVCYQNTDDYLENISNIIFNNSKIILGLKKQLNKIYLDIKGIEEVDVEDAALKHHMLKLGTHNLPKKIFKKIKVGKKLSIGLQLATMAMHIGMDKGINMYKKHKQLKALKRVSEEDLDYLLCVTALCISQASKLLSKEEFAAYFSSKMKVINEIKFDINKKMFEDLDKNYIANLRKKTSLDNFDNYIIKKFNYNSKLPINII